MEQPELGQRISELRQNLDMTQENLAEACGINVRSIQRIEAGETEPRANTIRKLNTIFGENLSAPATRHNQLWLVLMHLSSIIPVVVVALIIWVWKRDEDSKIAYQGIDVINFQISMWIYMMIAASAIIYVIGLLILPFMGIAITLITIINTLKVVQGQNYNYPFCIKFLRH